MSQEPKDDARDDSVMPERPADAIDSSGGGPAAPLTRRAALRVLGAVPLAGALAWTDGQGTGQAQTRQTHEGPNQPARDTKQPPPSPRKAKFFNAREARTLRTLADDIIPRDAHSGSASEAGVVDFIDFNLSVEETTADTRTAWRGGLRWMDAESRRRFSVAYAAATLVQRHQILDDIAWPEKARAELAYGAAFFTRCRDMVASGFFSSALGYQDLRYMGNVFIPEWKGCPEAALRKLGVSYDLMPKRDAR
ncbi:MAG: gluconate 2-dehydrogenase subunit 3 family protein [Gemmatimonadaceae bacterium]